MSTRAVSAAAGVQPPTIYRLFGDKQGLLDAVATHGFMAYLNDKTDLKPGDNPVEDLCTGGDLHVGLANPALFSLMYGDPAPARPRRRPSPPPKSSAGTSAASPRPGDCGSARNAPRISSAPPAAARRSR